MLGWIMPTPLATPLTVTGTGAPSGARQLERRTVAALARESVVRSASATAVQCSSSRAEPVRDRGPDGGCDAIDRAVACR